MQLGHRRDALGTAYLLRQRLLHGLVLGPGRRLVALGRTTTPARAGGGRGGPRVPGRSGETLDDRDANVLVSDVRPGRHRASSSSSPSGRGRSSSGIKELSLSSVETTLDEHQRRAPGQGASSFDNGGDYLSPVNLPAAPPPFCCVRSRGRPPLRSSSSRRSSRPWSWPSSRSGSRSLKDALGPGAYDAVPALRWIRHAVCRPRSRRSRTSGSSYANGHSCCPRFFVLLSVSGAPLARSSRDEPSR